MGPNTIKPKEKLIIKFILYKLKAMNRGGRVCAMDTSAVLFVTSTSMTLACANKNMHF